MAERAWLALLAGLVIGQPVSAQAGDRHAGYYYPIPATSEVYIARAKALQGANRRRRILFVTEMTNQMMEQPYAPPVAMFAKGEQAQKMIVTSLHNDGYDTLYRMRGFLAMMSARARSTPIFAELEVQDMFTFLDLLKMLGFERITVTDGDRFAHRIDIQ